MSPAILLFLALVALVLALRPYRGEDDGQHSIFLSVVVFIILFVVLFVAMIKWLPNLLK